MLAICLSWCEIDGCLRFWSECRSTRAYNCCSFYRIIWSRMVWELCFPEAIHTYATKPRLYSKAKNHWWMVNKHLDFPCCHCILNKSRGLWLVCLLLERIVCFLNRLQKCLTAHYNTSSFQFFVSGLFLHYAQISSIKCWKNVYLPLFIE